MGPCPASGRTGPEAASSNDIPEILGDCRCPSVGLVAVGQAAGAGPPVVVVAGSSGAVKGRVRDRDLGLIRRGLGHQPCRFAHRTPVLYSRYQPRTNITICERKGEKRGRVSLPSCS